MTLSIKNGEYAFLIRLDLILSMPLWKEFQLLQILNELSIKHLIKLGDSWNYMLPILVSSSVKCIAVPILAITKLNGKKIFWEALFVIPSIPSRNYRFKVSNWSTRKLFKIINEDTRTISMASFKWLYC